MKIIAITALLCMASATHLQAQNKNVLSEETIKITTVKDSDGEKTLVKTKKTNEQQDIELVDADSKALNKDTKDSPVNRTSTTEITAGGITRTIDVDRTAHYNHNGVEYHVMTDPLGYQIMTKDGQKAGVLRPTSNNQYIYKTFKETAYGYFDGDGNLILESYDTANDGVMVQKFMMQK